MFRGGADHVAAQKGMQQNIFADKAWTFNAEAPIRSSVAYSADAIYFGTSNGFVYALNKTTGAVKWKYNTGYAVNSSPLYANNKLFFADNKQTLYAVQASTGKLLWKFDFGTSLDYEWLFDYFYSSPTLVNSKIVIGSKDGYTYCINEADGKVSWKHKAEGIVRSTPAVNNGVVYIGDTEGNLYALQLSDGKEKWKFEIKGHTMKNEDFGFDRRAIISSPVVAGNNVLAGGRDGFLYCVNKTTGTLNWTTDHNVSWVISSVAVKDTIVVTGTSDGRFVQAVSLNTGKEIWKYGTLSIVWSSPLIYNNQVYIGSHDNVLYCFDVYTGKRLNSFQTGGAIFSSPVIADSLLYFGCDDGNLYALKPSAYHYGSTTGVKKMVYWEPGINNYFRYGTDNTIKEYLVSRGYTVIDSKKMAAWMSQKDSAVNSVIVFASNYAPAEVTAGYDKSPMRSYLDNGGKIVLLGNNPTIFRYDPNSKQAIGFNVPFCDSVLAVNYGPNDTRAFKGSQPAFPTAEGKQWGLRSAWVAGLSVPVTMVTTVLGKDENGLASSWVKKYNAAKGAGLVQIWVAPEGNPDYSYITRVAEYGLGNNTN